MKQSWVICFPKRTEDHVLPARGSDIPFHPGTDEKRGIAKFSELLRCTSDEFLSLSKPFVVAVFALRKPAARVAAQRFHQTGRFTPSVPPAAARAEYSQRENSHHLGGTFEMDPLLRQHSFGPVFEPKFVN